MDMVEIKLSNLNESEKSQLYQDVDGDSAGCGVIQTGKYHVLAYKPIKDKETYKCTGVELFIHKIQNDKQRPNIPSVNVYFKQSWLSQKEAFKHRLEKSVKKQTDLINKLDKAIDDEIERVAKEKLDRENAIKEHTEKVRSCQLKLDSTMKTIVPTAKSMIEFNHERMLAEAKPEEPTPALETTIEPESVFNFEPHTSEVRTEVFLEKDYVSERERQFAINDAFLHQTVIRERPRKSKSTVKTQAKSKDVVKDQVFNKNQKNMVNVKMNDTLVVEAELLMPSDTKYLTDLERQQATKNREITLMSPNVLR